MAGAKTSSTSKAERDTLAKVRAHISDVETRLKKADSANKRSVTALRKAFDALAAQSGAVDPSELNARLDALAANLERQMEGTRRDVAAKLQVALSTPRDNPDQLGHILSASRAASERITQGEIRQAESIQKINQQIARLAAALDARLQTETRERLALDARLKEEIAARAAREAYVSERAETFEMLTEQRIMAVEDQSAEALSGIGERISVLSAEMAKRAQADDLRVEGLIQESLYEVALDQQQELERHRNDIEHRLAQKDAAQSDSLAPLQRSIATLSARLESLEQGMISVISTAPERAAPPYPNAPTSAVSPQDYKNASFKDEDQGESASRYRAFMPTDAFSPQEETSASAPVEAPAQTPARYAQMPDLSAQATQSENPYANLTKGEVKEFDPSMMPAAPERAAPYAQSAPPPPFENAPHYDAAQNLAEGYAQTNPYASQQEPTQFSTDHFYGEQNGQNAGYAEQGYPAQNYNGVDYNAADQVLPLDQSMNAARPGAPMPVQKGKKAKAKKEKGPALPGLSKRTLRTAAGAAALFAVATVGTVIVKNQILDNTDPQASLNASNTRSAPDTPSREQSREIDPRQAEDMPRAEPAPAFDVTLTEATGDLGNGASLADTQPQVAEFATLEAALEAGNPIAQLQYGQILMQRGNPEEAADYFRKSASQGQPAAQYYLADLYAAGEGVAADPAEARKLTAMAAQSGHRIAMYDLALYFADDAQSASGADAEKAIQTAASWFRKAADFGMTDAQFNLAALHSAPSSSLTNPLEAYVWYSIAAKQGDQEAGAQAQILRGMLPGDALGRAEARIAGFTPASINQPANGIFTDLAWNKKRPNRNPDVATVQTLLTGLGFEAGIADGAMGPKTREAIRAFERSNGLPETGQVNSQLIEKLQSVSGA